MPCRSAVPPGELVQAVEEFNRGEWFQCHETLEELWVGEKGELRDFYQGVLQIAVALHHWRNGNFKGAVILLQGGGDCLRRVSSVCLQLDVARLREDASAFLETLTVVGEERMAEVEPSLVPRLHLLC